MSEDGELKRIYILLTLDGKYMKLGRSDNIIKRLSRLEHVLNNNPYVKQSIGLNLWFITKVGYSLRHEQDCHILLKRAGLHIKGEWYHHNEKERDKIFLRLRDLDGINTGRLNLYKTKIEVVKR